MTDQITTTDDDDDDIDDDFYDDDSEWEDSVAYQEILNKVPPGWDLIKVFGYTYTTLIEMEEWCQENCQGPWEKVRWSSGCSYSTGIQMELDMDIVLFKLRWGC